MCQLDFEFNIKFDTKNISEWRWSVSLYIAMYILWYIYIIITYNNLFYY